MSLGTNIMEMIDSIARLPLWEIFLVIFFFIAIFYAVVISLVYGISYLYDWLRPVTSWSEPYKHEDWTSIIYIGSIPFPLRHRGEFERDVLSRKWRWEK